MHIAPAPAAVRPERPPARADRRGARESGRQRGRPALRPVQGHPPQRVGRGLRAREDLDRDDQGVPGGARRPGAASARVREEVVKLTDGVVAALMKRKPEGGAIHIEEIQDQVELALMRGGEHEVARAYVLYREKRAQERAAQKTQRARRRSPTTIHVVENGIRKPLDIARMTALVARVLRRAGRRRRRSDPEGDAEGPLRRRADGRGAQVRRARRAHADREGPALQLRDRAPAARRAALRGARRGGDAGGDGAASTPSTSRAS